MPFNVLINDITINRPLQDRIQQGRILLIKALAARSHIERKVLCISQNAQIPIEPTCTAAIATLGGRCSWLCYIRSAVRRWL